MTLPKAFHNQVLCADVMDTLAQLPNNCLDLVLGDPDYNVGVNYAGKNFSMPWDDYIAWLCTLAREALRVLKPTGNLFMFNLPKQNAHLRVMCLDNIAHRVHEYVWVYNTNLGHSPKHFTGAHRSILHACKTTNNQFFKHQVALPYQNPSDKRCQAQLAKGSHGRMPYSWLNFNLVKNVSKEKTAHPCQIPSQLSKLLIEASTQPGDSVFVLFGGSGAEVCLAKDLGLTYLACELHPEYHRMIKEKLCHGNV